MNAGTKSRGKGKRYEIYCVTKHDKNVFLHRVIVRERNLGYAKKMAHDIIAQKTHHHAFHLGTNLPREYDWDGISKTRHVSIDSIRALALADGGWAIYDR